MKTNKTAEEYYKESYDLLLAKQIPEAIHFCRKALRLNPKFRDPYLRLGSMLSLIRRYDEASDYYSRYLRYSTEAENKLDISKAYNAIGHLHLQKRDVYEALKYFEFSLDILKVLKLEKEIARCYNNKALAYRIDRNFQKAQKYYRKAINISKKEKHLDRIAYYYFNIAIMFKEQKKYFKAVWYMRKYKKINKILKKKGLLPTSKNQLVEV